MTIQEQLDEEFITLEEKYNAMLSFLEEYQPWEILFQEHIKQIKAEKTKENSEKVM